jgi:hypothetical protein
MGMFTIPAALLLMIIVLPALRGTPEGATDRC